MKAKDTKSYFLLLGLIIEGSIANKVGKISEGSGISNWEIPDNSRGQNREKKGVIPVKRSQKKRRMNE